MVMDASVQSDSRQPDSGVAPSLPGNLHDRIGQMMLVGFRGLTPAEAQPAMRRIAEGSIGAVALYDLDLQIGGPRNIASPQQLAELVGAVKATGPIPPLVAIDAEGGFFHKLREDRGFAPTAAAAEMGERNDLEFSRSNAGVIADMLHAAGIDLNLAPVVDLLNPTNWNSAYLRRTISADPAIVVAHAREFILAHRQRGVLTSLKHFPGLRGAIRPYAPGVGEVIEGWSEVELQPFAALIGEGLADAVMTTRSTYPALDSQYPASLSKKVVEGLLRGRLGYDGVVISDLLELQAIWDGFGFQAGTVLAVNAGIDILFLGNETRLVPYSDDRADEMIRVISDAVARGEIAESRIDEACRRIMTLKARVVRA
jgi:beta-N-acetylhexosaminidase